MYVSRRTSSRATSMAASIAGKCSAPLLRSVIRLPRTGIRRKSCSGCEASGECDVVREPVPRSPDVALDPVELEVADVDAIEREDRHACRVAARMPPLGALEN